MALAILVGSLLYLGRYQDRIIATELDSLLLQLRIIASAVAEGAARDGEASLRKLTTRLLQMQDEERRKFSRELHDSLGQYLAGVKMNLEMFSQTQPSDFVRRVTGFAEDRFVVLADRRRASRRDLIHAFDQKR